jgi:carboxyl-terminal processing protease
VLLIIDGLSLRLQAVPLDSRLNENERRAQQKETLQVVDMLQGMHYLEKPFRDFSVRELVERFTDDLDPSRDLFLAGDVEFIARRFDRSMKPVYLFKGDLHPAFEIYEQYLKRVGDWQNWEEQRLTQPFSFTKDEFVETDRRKAPRPSTPEQQQAFWEASLRYRVMEEILAGRSMEQAIDKVREKCRVYLRRVQGADIQSVRERFLNSLLGLFDPHSGYFSRDSAEAFEIEMSGILVGVGLDVRQKEERFLVQTVHEGGPADLSGSVLPGDELLAVAEKDGQTVPLKGRAMRDLAKLISGKAGSELVLTLRSGKEGPERKLSLVRGPVNLGMKRARGRLARLAWQGREYRLGLIRIPSFYAETAQKGTSMSADVRELLDSFAQEGVEGIVIDLRDNGGGLIAEAVSLAGLFLGKADVVMSKGLNREVKIFRDEDGTFAYTGPLVVLDNERSASASELFTGAMKCYRRALVVGDAHSFGKGSVQGFVDLRKAYGGQLGALQENWGMLRVTQELYFLPDGSSPQLQGIASDVVLPFFPHPGLTLERDMPKVLPPQNIAASLSGSEAVQGAAALDPELKARLLAQAAERLRTLPEFDYLRRASAWYSTVISDAHQLSLLLGKARQREEANDTAWVSFASEYRALRSKLAFASTEVDIPAVKESHSAHQQALRRRLLPDGAPCLNRFHEGILYFEESPGGRIRELQLGEIDFTASLSKAEEFVGLWTDTLGQKTDAAVMTALLKELSRPDRVWNDEPEYAGIFEKYTTEKASAAALSKLMDLFLTQAARNDFDSRTGTRYFDMSMLESLRCCCDWSAALPASSTPRVLFPAQSQ